MEAISFWGVNQEEGLAALNKELNPTKKKPVTFNVDRYGDSVTYTERIVWYRDDLLLKRRTMTNDNDVLVLAVVPEMRPEVIFDLKDVMNPHTVETHILPIEKYMLHVGSMKNTRGDVAPVHLEIEIAMEDKELAFVLAKEIAAIHMKTGKFPKNIDLASKVFPKRHDDRYDAMKYANPFNS